MHTLHTAVKMNKSFLSFCIIHAIFISLGFAEEACYSYGGGHVYPQETTRSTVGQNLVTSKAQSRISLFFLCLLCFQSHFEYNRILM